MPTPSQHPARQHVTVDAPVKLRRGHLPGMTIAYETWGEPVGNGDNAVLLFTGMSPSAHAACSEADPAPGWWEAMIGPDKPLDTNRFFVVCVNSLGSCFGSTGPASTNPATGEPWCQAFPVLTIEDIAAAAMPVLEHLGITHLHSVVGPSMGGMSALAFTVRFPGFARQLVSISSAARAEPQAIALRSLQREIVRSDPAWNGGNYRVGTPDHGPLRGMRLARKLGMISYRSGVEWSERFGRQCTTDVLEDCDPYRMDFEVEAYLDHQARKFAGTFDPNCYLYLSRAMDLYDLADYGGSLEAGFKRVGVERALVVGVETDALFPLRQQQELAAGLEAAGVDTTSVTLPSLQGHDAFLVDMERFRPVVAGAFAA